MTSPRTDPLVSVVIPTYNRRNQLHDSLLQLTRQRPGTPEFEVVVSDDGSSDDSASVARSFSDRLRLKYHFQSDEGNRVALARNEGARLASAPILVFLDTGALPGPEFVQRHFLAHQEGSPRCALLGYAYGYNPEAPMWEVPDILRRHTPEEAVHRYGQVPEFLDLREGVLAECGGDLERRSLPWQVFWTINCSMRTDDFWSVGGFDNDHRGWAVEDLELGYLLHRKGLPIRLDRTAWVIESLQERKRREQLDEFKRNMLRMVSRHPDPVHEIGWALVDDDLFWPWEDEYNELLRHTREVRDLDVATEIEQALRGSSPTDTVAVVGVGGHVPDSLGPGTVMDFDRELVDRVVLGGRHVGHHSLGLRTPLADQSVDIVVITSRLAGLWDRWKDRLLAEAHRVGRDVRCFS
ncbi:glycosyltransferase [Plantactinospora soyae]|uniref:Glycosyltransferase involved in cell wall biosynthesis n=1 Tax=Plantactinospora soyae TaxID=1544732 RepID=A0A927M3Y2_9ACTN|nr:glycosyltransferase [Plantactinospora soyae]MBE1487554.1 glycosyltransferase involved in cell wall biosynthesis [Plantactinospora soyae]